MGKCLALHPWLWPRSALDVKKTLEEAVKRSDSEDTAMGSPCQTCCCGGCQQGHTAGTHNVCTVDIQHTVSLQPQGGVKTALRSFSIAPASSSSLLPSRWMGKCQNSMLGCCASPGSNALLSIQTQKGSPVFARKAAGLAAAAHALISQLSLQQSFNLFAQNYLSTILKSHTHTRFQRFKMF